MTWSRNSLLLSFSGVDPATLTSLFCTFCLSLHGAATWSLSTPTLHSLEVAFNNILRKIWCLPFNCHTSTARLHNLIFRRSQSLLTSATIKCPSILVRNVYSVSAIFCTATGYNSLNGASHLKQYSLDGAYCANFIRELRVYGSTSLSIELLTRTISLS